MIERHSSSHKITAAHLARKAVVYLRQSSLKQVRENLESQRLQYALADRARALGFQRAEGVGRALGRAGAGGGGADLREISRAVERAPELQVVSRSRAGASREQVRRGASEARLA